VRPLLGSESPPGEPAPLGSELDHLTNDVLLARARIFLEELVARAHAGDVEAVDKLWELANLVACSLERLAEEHADIMKIIARLWPDWPARCNFSGGRFEQIKKTMRKLELGSKSGVYVSRQINTSNPLPEIAGALIATFQVNRELLAYQMTEPLPEVRRQALEARYPGVLRPANETKLPSHIANLLSLSRSPSFEEAWPIMRASFEECYPDFDALPQLASVAVHLRDCPKKRRTEILKQLKQATKSRWGQPLLSK